TAVTAPRENCHLLNRNRIYKNTTTNDPMTAQNDSVLISSAMVGLTLLENICPIFLSPEPTLKSSKVIPFGRYGIKVSKSSDCTFSSASAVLTSTKYFVDIFNWCELPMVFTSALPKASKTS